jgi:SpoVK/Ycf46/Vps4 family AAA+-type ATPase
MESIIKSLGIPLTPTTNIIINNKTKKTIISSPTKSLSEDKENAEEKEEINTLELYKIGNSYFTINLEKVFKMKGHLIKLKKMIGLDKIKSEIIDMILYYLMEFEKKNNNMLHMTLEGSPGCGKTKLAKIISKLLGAMGILDNDKVVYARRTDMIGQYLGQTGQKTQQVINSALGGVLFIDEAYSLGNSKKDIYSKECLDILNQNLSDNKKKLVCIIAGYPEELENYFFSSNPGLTRRFPFRFKINNYTHSELLDIFINKINKLEWKINKNVNLTEFFEKNISHFKYFGGDIDTLIQDIKYSHSRRVVCAHPSDFKIINKDDINKAFEKFKNRRKTQESENWKGMFV